MESLSDSELSDFILYCTEYLSPLFNSDSASSEIFNLEETITIAQIIESYCAAGGHNIDLLYTQIYTQPYHIIDYVITTAATIDYFLPQMPYVASRKLSCADAFYLETGVTIAEAGIDIATDDFPALAIDYLEFTEAYTRYRMCVYQQERQGAC